MIEINLLNSNIEIWKVIEGFEDYSVSNLGRVKSFKGYGGIEEKILTLKNDKDGYKRIILYKDGKKLNKRINRLVLETFKPIENANDLESNHINGIKSDNRLKNLEWCTCSENKKHSYRIGLRISKKGEKHPMSILTNYKVNVIRQIFNSPITKQLKITQEEIGYIFEVSRRTIGRIVNRKIWKHI